jgi:hypothetical protein
LAGLVAPPQPSPTTHNHAHTHTYQHLLAILHLLLLPCPSPINTAASSPKEPLKLRAHVLSAPPTPEAPLQAHPPTLNQTSPSAPERMLPHMRVIQVKPLDHPFHSTSHAHNGTSVPQTAQASRCSRSQPHQQAPSCTPCTSQLHHHCHMLVHPLPCASHYRCYHVQRCAHALPRVTHQRCPPPPPGPLQLHTHAHTSPHTAYCASVSIMQHGAAATCIHTPRALPCPTLRALLPLWCYVSDCSIACCYGKHIFSRDIQLLYQIWIRYKHAYNKRSSVS